MLVQFQIDMLAAAAKHEGRIAQILFFAILHSDLDTVKYITQHYATTEHFTDEQLSLLQTLREDIAQFEAQQTVH